MAVELTFTNNNEDIDSSVEAIDTRNLESVIEALNEQPELKIPDGNINVEFVTDDEIQVLNKTHSGNDYPTDVLSFSYIEDGGESIEGTLGDIAISRETAARQAEKAETDLETEIALLGLHGVLHILGYDHAEDADREEVDSLQGSIMSAAGLTYRDFEWDL